VKSKFTYLSGLIALAAVCLHAQPTNGPVYWSPTQPDCSTLNENPVAITSGGKTIGYSCYVSGAFQWLAAGGGWGTTIRVSAPASAPIGVNYSFYDTGGANQNLDTTINNVASSLNATNQVSFALAADQPAEVELLGAAHNGPAYGTAANGSVYSVFYCPDANTCANVLPQLLYSELPTNPWMLSVPLAFDQFVWTQWSAVGINGPGQFAALVIYNEDLVANTYKITIFDTNGTQVGSATTHSIPAGQNLGNGTYGQGGTYGVLLSQLVPNLPQGVFKVLVDGGTHYSAVVVLQFNGPSASSLQVAYDSAPPVGAGTVAAARRMSLRASRVEAMPKEVFSPAPR